MIDDEYGTVAGTIGKKTEVLRENMPQYHVVHHESHMP
jgi:hypothetical protein